MIFSTKEVKLYFISSNETRFGLSLKQGRSVSKAFELYAQLTARRSMNESLRTDFLIQRSLHPSETRVAPS